MPKGKLSIVLVLLFVSLGLEASAAEEKPSPSSQASKKVVASPAVQWQSSVHRTQYDFGTFNCWNKLISTEARRVELSKDGLPFRIRLTRPGGEVEHASYHLPPLHWTSPSGEIGEEGRFCDFRIELAKAFESFPPGDYEVQLAIRGDAIKLDGEPLSNKEWLEGPAVSFTSCRFEAAKIPASEADDVAVKLYLDDWKPFEGFWSAEVINRGRQPISIIGYVGDRDVKPTDEILCPFGWEYFLPHCGWMPTFNAGCGAGAGKIVIEPGKSQRITLYAIKQFSTGCGVHRFVIFYQTAMDVTKQTRTSPFVIRSDHVSPIPNPKK